ncbi:GIY-YIG nuclease family protein [Pandoraea pnomenusa]|uniref:GIY-YIG nuclease family protein n=1 Tax=Pandoraea pnomenusa TaxID=93220 RepID=UPI00334229D1
MTAANVTAAPKAPKAPKVSEAPNSQTGPKPWFLYLLECAGGRIYTGITVDVDARFAAHVSGKGARFTRAYPPSRILLSLTFVDRSAASRAEHRVKQLSASQKRGLIAGTYVCDFGDRRENGEGDADVEVDINTALTASAVPAE